MKGFLEKLKDFIYDSIDYFVMIAIVIVVVMVIGWRLDVLFAKDPLDTPNPPPIVADGTDIDDKDDNNVPNHDKNKDDDSNMPNPDENENDDNNDIADEDQDLSPDNSQKEPSDDSDTKAPDSTSTTVTITIPDGTLPSGIGAILESNGLVSNKNDFVIKAQSMELDRKLRSGTYKILENSSLEEIVKIIARQN